MHDLINAKRLGYRACILFVIQRSDAVAFVPNTKADPQFGRTLKFAKHWGVEVYARKCKIKNFQIQLGKRLPVIL